MFTTGPKTGALVQFKLADVVCPVREEVVDQINDSLTLQGRVVMLSDAGDKRDHFAIIQVGGVDSPLIVPVKQINEFRALAREDGTKQ